MVKKFYQKYTLRSPKEAIIIAALYKNAISDVVAELFTNLFCTEDMVDNSCLDLSCCFLVTEELQKTIDDWSENYNFFEDVLGSFDNLNGTVAYEGLRVLYYNMLNGNKLTDAIIEDRIAFGGDVSFYSNDPFVLTMGFIDAFEE